MDINRRTGYLHALEGVIAAFIVGLYLTSLVSTPASTDWTESHISKRSEDLLSALDRSGVMDKTVMRDDLDSFNGFMRSVDSSVAYDIQVSGLPLNHIDIGVAVNDSQTMTASTTTQQNAPGAPPTDTYRAGTILGHDFVVSDLSNDNVQDYTALNIDWNDNGNYGDAGEGPYRFGARFQCPAGTPCAGDYYEIGELGHQVTLYEAAVTQRLADRISTASIGMRNVTLDFHTTQLADTDQFEAVLIYGWPIPAIEQHQDRLTEFLSQNRFLGIISPIQNDQVDGSFLADLGFDYVEERALIGTGPQTNVLHGFDNPDNQSYTANNYYLETPLIVTEYTSQGGGERTGSLTVQDEPVQFQIDTDTDTVSFDSESHAVDYTVGDTVVLQGNTYRIISIDPLKLRPQGQQQFASFGTQRIAADYGITRMAQYTYNTSLYDVNTRHTENITDRNRIPNTLVDPRCNLNEYPYRRGTATIDGTDHTFWIVNFNTDLPCDTYYEYMYVDTDADGSIDHDEGPFQTGEHLSIDGDGYAIRPSPEGMNITFRRDGPRVAAEFPISRQTQFGGGTTALIGRTDLGHDGLGLLQSVLVAETADQYQFTSSKTLGGQSLGYTYSANTGQDPAESYMLHTVWWFR